MTNRKRHISDLSGEEIAELGRDQVRRVREESFAVGLPVIFMRDGVAVYEYPDGRIEPIDKADVTEAAE